MVLNPNCSEVVWRLDYTKSLPIKEQIVKSLLNSKKEGANEETWTDQYPNGCVETMMDLIDDAKEKGLKVSDIEFVYVDNEGGGGNSYYVEQCWILAKKYGIGEISKSYAIKQENKIWNGEDQDPDPNV